MTQMMAYKKYDMEELGLLYEDEEEESLDHELPPELRQEKGADAGRIYSPEDALYMSVNQLGKVNLEYMSRLSGYSMDELIHKLHGKLIWQSPEDYDRHQDPYQDWLLLSQYAVGNSYALMKKAEFMNRRYPHRFDRNIELIRRLRPEMPECVDIYTQLGASWVTNYYYKLFIKDLLKMLIPPHIQRDLDDKWILQNATPPERVANEFTYGTKRMPALKIIEHTINGITVKVTDPVPADTKSGVKYVINREETLIAQEKQRLIQTEFDNWIHNHPEAMERITSLYAEKFSYIRPKYDGSFLQLPGLNPEVSLYKHQRDAAARILFSKNVLLSHDVGSGKTYEFIIGVHELYRLNISTSNLIVVPNNVLNDAVKMHKYLYPKDQILIIRPSRFKSNKRKCLELIRTKDCVAIYMAASSFDRITMSKDYYIRKIRNELIEINDEMRSSADRSVISQLSDKYNRLQGKLSKLKEEKEQDLCEGKDTTLECFDLLGITGLVIDEAHNYKNITISSRLENIVGLHSKGSKKADSMLDKVHYIQDKGGNVIFSTGTVITNSLSDLYVFQMYLQPEELKALQLYRFGDWVNSFCSVSTFFEIDVDSQNFRYMTRFNKYHNLPELMAMFSTVSDFYHIDEEDIQLPEFHGYTNVVVPKNEYQNAYLKTLAERTDEVRSGDVDRTEDNILMIIQDGRKLALDIRILDPEAEIAGQPTKTSFCARKVCEVYRAYPGMAQVVFCDLSTPKSGFNVYDELKCCLIEQGIPEEEIAFIHDGTNDEKRNRLIRELDEGKLRVMVGSTAKLGLGVNIQAHLIAVHHLDAPWKPSDITQREGRIIRQGNINEQVLIFRYVTEGSFDSYVWQILENKRRFIGSFLSGTLSRFHREESEIDAIELDYAEVKALCIGNPWIRDRVMAANELEHHKIAQYQRRKQLADLNKLLQTLPEKIEKVKNRMQAVRTDDQYYRRTWTSVGKEERMALGEELLLAINDNIRRDSERYFGDYQGFRIYLPEQMTYQDPFIRVRRDQKDGGTYEVPMKGLKPAGVTRKLDYLFVGLEKRYEELSKKRDTYIRQMEDAQKEIALGNSYDAVVLDDLMRLEELDAKLRSMDES